MAGFVLGLDAGSGSARALLLNVETGETRSAARGWTHRPSPGEAWGWDFNTERNWELMAEAVRECVRAAGARPGEILGAAVTSMRHTLVVLKDGRAVFAVPNRDARASGEASALAADHGPQLQQRTGRWPSPIFMVCRLLWLAAHHPEWLEQARALTLSDWFAWRLCGEIATDASHAGESMLFDVAASRWRFDWADRLGLPRHVLPDVRAAGEILGRLGTQAAADLGLGPGIPVAVGGADTQCALLGLGALAAGEIGIVSGTTAPIQAVVDRPIIDPDRRLWTGVHVVPGRWVVEAIAGSLGDGLDWFARMLYPASPRPVARLMAEASRAPVGAGGIYSTFAGQVFDGSAMGLPVGSLTLSHLTAGESESASGRVARAVLEGMAYAVRANLEQVAALARSTLPWGESQPGIRLTGGMTRSRFWPQLLADVLGVPLQVAAVPESTALGAAICAAVGAGVYGSLAEAVQALTRLRTVEAGEEAARRYRSLYADWQRLRQAQREAEASAADLILQQIAEQPAAPAPTPVPFRPRILVTAQMDDASLARLRHLGEVEYAPYREAMRLLTGDDLVEALQGVHVFITEVDIVDVEALRRLPDLRLIVSCRGQVVNVDLAACTALGIPVLHTPGRNAQAVADLTLAFLLMLSRKLAPANEFLRQPGGEAGDMGRMGQAHEEFLGRELWGKTVGLVGFGAVAREVARRLAPFGARVLACDPYLEAEEADRFDVELVRLEALLEQADFVSLHAAVTDETRGLIGRDALRRMKAGAFLVNTARAALVDEEALAEALREGRLAGAALDVFSVEPPGADHPLLALPNVIATPHVGGNTLEVARHQGEAAAADLERMLAGMEPHHCLNPETLAGFRWDRRQAAAADEALGALSDRPAPSVTDLQPPARPTLPGMGEEAEPARKEEAARMSVPSEDTKAQMESVLRAFVEKARSDPALIAYAAGRKVISHYTVSDLGLEFYVGFRQGVVEAGLGPPAEPAEVRMKASAETLDGILTGRISGNKAAMSGKLSFSGDVRLAMGMQRVQGDIIRLYSAARDEAGGIDFTALRQKMASSLAAAGRTLEAPSDPRQELVEAVHELYTLQLITATGGNLSVRIPETSECWITPSQIYKGGLRPEAMVRIDFDGNPLDPGALAPSSERAVHTEIYRARPDVQAVVHTHAPYATILGLSRLPFLPVTTDAAFLKDLPLVPFIMPGTKELAQAVVAAMGKHPACIMQNHGLVVAASTLRRAINLTEAIERTAQLILGCYAVGKKPATLPKEVVRMLQELGEMMA